MTNIKAVEFYWRPGCPFCSRLERALNKAAIPLDKRNIWDDSSASAFVKSVAGGNETVPTVKVGSQPLVNPSLGEVKSTLKTEVPELLESIEQNQQGKGGWWNPVTSK